MGRFDEQVQGKVKKIQQEVIRRSSKAGNYIRNEVIKTLSGQGHGRWYGNHQASAPGEAPAQDTGALRNSFDSRNEVKITGNNAKIDSSAWSNLAKSGVSPGFNYAYINYGTSTIAPRPYVDKAREAAKEKLIKDLRRPYDV